jgi:hypothetical protein
MTDESGIARVRISRWRPKMGGAEISVLPTRPAPDDTNFVPTLIWALDQARRGNLVGYAMVFSVHDAESETVRCMEAAKAWDDMDRHHVLGLIRRMEAGYMKRSWPEDDES